MYNLRKKIYSINSPKERLSFLLKYEIKYIAEYYINLFKDYRSYIIKTSKKKDLIQSIINLTSSP
jgi:hypothetical protein